MSCSLCEFALSFQTEETIGQVQAHSASNLRYVRFDNFLNNWVHLHINIVSLHYIFLKLKHKWNEYIFIQALRSAQQQKEQHARNAISRIASNRMTVSIIYLIFMNLFLEVVKMIIFWTIKCKFRSAVQNMIACILYDKANVFSTW